MLSRLVENETKRMPALEYCVCIAHNLPRYSFYTTFALLCIASWKLIYVV
jgi:hypothetical protein